MTSDDTTMVRKTSLINQAARSGDRGTKSSNNDLEKTIAALDAEQPTPTAEPVEPDGGYGWVCVCCCFWLNAHTWGINSVSIIPGNVRTGIFTDGKLLSPMVFFWPTILQRQSILGQLISNSPLSVVSLSLKHF